MLINANWREKKNSNAINKPLRVQNKPNAPTATACADKTTRASLYVLPPIHTISVCGA